MWEVTDNINLPYWYSTGKGQKYIRANNKKIDNVVNGFLRILNENGKEEDVVVMIDEYVQDTNEKSSGRFIYFKTKLKTIKEYFHIGGKELEEKYHGKNKQSETPIMYLVVDPNDDTQSKYDENGNLIKNPDEGTGADYHTNEEPKGNINDYEEY